MVKTKEEQKTKRWLKFVLLGSSDSFLISGVLYMIFNCLQTQRKK